MSSKKFRIRRHDHLNHQKRSYRGGTSKVIAQGLIASAVTIGIAAGISQCKSENKKEPTNRTMAAGNSAGLPTKSENCAVPLTEITTYAGSFNVGSGAEWQSAKDVIVHTPGEEIFAGVIHPDAALFEKPFSLEGARKEHDQFICLMKSRGMRVFRLTDILMAGTVDDTGRKVQGKALADLQEFAGNYLNYDTSGLPADLRTKQEDYRKSVLKELHPRELVKIIFQKPTVKLVSTGAHNTGLKASYTFDPVMNHYFMRDQVITTAKGLVVGKFNAAQRDIETQIATFAYKKLGIKPVYEIKGDGRLEGGDFLPAGDTAFLGQGLRTNAAAVGQLLSADAFGTKRVVIVKDPWQNQVQMHLDTYFNIANSKLAMMVEDRMDLKDASGRIIKAADPKKKPTADVYELIGGQYKIVEKDVEFQGYLEKTLGYKILPASIDDQLKYGLNFLTVKADEILAIDGVSQEYKDRIKGAGVNATWMTFGNLTSGYGAAHCTTQVIRRE